ncbi:NAD-dependent epimerase [Dolichospermum flos-aquae LEGE 04289]|uniref:NAD-dependent epimerase n=1 Tax=Dolichospermum flos-aquae LEGE 04289 TaxID=1828708 RepID=A0ACC5Q2G9_DOLFA|nr:NAD-dependent epimerase [Dolichospermum flos-aquae LEGE 04289]
MKMVKIIVTGAAGFIGFHLSQKLLYLGYQVLGIDNLNNYYDVALKQARLSQLVDHPNFEFQKLELSSQALEIFKNFNPETVVHLAAQAGVRYSLQNPHAYVDSNLVSFVNILESCRHHQIKHLVYASSSSVYGSNTKVPFSVDDPVNTPVSFYAATKRANELMAYTYSHLYQIPITGLRFFTVYGPWGRPDMAYFSFTRNILAKQTIDIFNNGNMRRDFTYIDDIIEGIVRVIAKPPQPELQSNPSNIPVPPHRIYNIGNNQPIKLLYFLEVLENCLGIKAEKRFLPLQPGDVLETYADIDDLMRDTGFKPETSIEIGLSRFVNWYRDYYN